MHPEQFNALDELPPRYDHRASTETDHSNWSEGSTEFRDAEIAAVYLPDSRSRANSDASSQSTMAQQQAVYDHLHPHIKVEPNLWVGAV